MQLSRFEPASCIVATEGLGKAFDGIRVLDDVSLTVAPGEVLGLVGENGAGKSTLIKCLAGALAPDFGAILWQGQPVALAGPAAAERLGLRVIHQELNLVPFFDTVENVYLGRPYPAAFGRVRWSSMRATVGDLARRLAPELPLDVPVRRLSPGQQQIVTILRALLNRAKVVIMDEPTAALSAAESERLFRIVAELKSDGVAVIYVSHRLEEVLALSDRISVLRDGKLVACAPASGLDAGALVQHMSGERLSAPRLARTAAPGEPVLTVARAASSGSGLEVRAREIVGVYGLMGSGRSRLLRRIFGAGGPAGAGMTLAGSPYAPQGPRDAIRRGVALVPEDRRSMGLVLVDPVRRNLTMALPRAFRRWPRLPLPSAGKERAFTEQIRRLLRVAFASAEQPVGRLSGGNQQKILLGRWLARRNRLYLLDEPTRGIDVAAKGELHDHIRQLADEGAGVLVATSDLAELLDLSDRVLVMHGGAIAASFTRDQASPRAVLDACYGA